MANKKDEALNVIRKAHEITPVPYLSKRKYSAGEVLDIIHSDRNNQINFYANYLRQMTIK